MAPPYKLVALMPRRYLAIVIVGEARRRAGIFRGLLADAVRTGHVTPLH